MITLILTILLVLTALALYKKKKEADSYYAAKESQIAKHISSGDKNAAIDVYLSILEEEYAREVPRAAIITRYTDRVLPLLRVMGRIDDEMCVLRFSMSKCVMHTHGRSWNKWQRRLAYLDSLYPDR